MRQSSKFQRRLAAGAFLIVAGPVALGSVAYACQSLATLHANPSSAVAGGTVNVTGKNYSSATSSTPVQIRLDDRDGPILATFPAGVRDINGPVTIPAGTAVGVHTLIATQYTSTGNAVSGTPGRATVTVTVAGRSAGEGSAATPAAAAARDSATAPVAATPAAPAAQAASAPAAAAATTAGAGTLSPAAAAPAAAAAATAAGAPAAADAAAPAGTPAAAAAAAPVAAVAADQAAPAAQSAAQVDAGLISAAAPGSSSTLPGLTLVAAAALVLLGLGAFVKSGRNILGRNTLAG